MYCICGAHCSCKQRHRLNTYTFKYALICSHASWVIYYCVGQILVMPLKVMYSNNICLTLVICVSVGRLQSHRALYPNIMYCVCLQCSTLCMCGTLCNCEEISTVSVRVQRWKWCVVLRNGVWFGLQLPAHTWDQGVAVWYTARPSLGSFGMYHLWPGQEWFLSCSCGGRSCPRPESSPLSRLAPSCPMTAHAIIDSPQAKIVWMGFCARHYSCCYG